MQCQHSSLPACQKQQPLLPLFLEIRGKIAWTLEPWHLSPTVWLPELWLLFRAEVLTKGIHSRGLGHATWPGSKWQTAMNRVIRKYNRSHNIKPSIFYYKKGFYGMVRSITPYAGSWWCLGSLLLLSVCNHISAHLSA